MRRLIIGITLLCTSGTLMAQQAWTLEQCVTYAIENNLTVKQREVMQKQREVALSTARNSRLPDLNASASESLNFGRGLTADNTYVSRNTQSTNLSLGTSIPLFTGFRIPNQIALSRLNLQTAAEELAKAKEDISVQVASAYLQVLLSKDMWQVAVEQTRLSKEQQLRLERFLEEGKIAETEVSEARSRTAQDKLSEVQAENAYRLAVLDLTQLLEIMTPEGFEVAEPAESEPQAPTDLPETIYQKALAVKPGVKAEELRLQGLERTIRIARAGYYPQLNLSAGIGSNYYKTAGYRAESFGRQLDNNLNKSIGLSLSIPIFNRFSTRNAIRDAKLQYESQSLQLDVTRKALYKEIQQAYYNAVASEAKYRSSCTAEQAAMDAFTLMEKKYEQGKATATEYNEAKTRRFKAVSERLQARYDGLLRAKILAFYKGEPIR